jgi:protein TonB
LRRSKWHPREWSVAFVGGVVVHIALVGVLFAADELGLGRQPPEKQVVTMEILAPPPPPKLTPPPPPPPEPPPAIEAPKPTPVKKLPAKLPPPAPEPPPPDPTPPPPVTPEPPAPGPAAPAAPTFKMPAVGAPGTMAVPPGQATRSGSGRGAGGGNAPGTGGGGDADSTGTGAKPVSIATVKRMPEPLGDYDVASDRLYTAEGKRALIEGKVEFRLTIDEKGNVAAIKLLRGLGFGLDENARKFVATLKFRPAIDGNDQPVATTITWGVKFNLPDE